MRLGNSARVRKEESVIRTFTLIGSPTRAPGIAGVKILLFFFFFIRSPLATIDMADNVNFHAISRDYNFPYLKYDTLSMKN